jgi:hypothetical protein
MAHCLAFVNTGVSTKRRELSNYEAVKCCDKSGNYTRAARREVTESSRYLSERAPSGGFKTAALRDRMPEPSYPTISYPILPYRDDSCHLTIYLFTCLQVQCGQAFISYPRMRRDPNSAALNRKRNRQFASSDAPVQFTQQIIRYQIKRTKAAVLPLDAVPFKHKTLTAVNTVLKK